MADTGFGSGSFGGVATPTFRRKVNQNDPFGVGVGSDSSVKGNPFDITNTPLYKETQSLVSSQMKGDTPEFEAQANVARDAQTVASYNSAKAKREQLINSGLRNSGQYLQEGLMGTADQTARDQADLERRLASDRQNLIQQKQAQGLSAAQNLLGVQASQNQSNAQISSNERIAGMNIQADQWKTMRTEQLTKEGWSNDAAQQKAQQEWQSREAALNRQQSSEQFSQTLGLDKAKFEETKRQFDTTTAQQESQFNKTYGLETAKFNEAAKQFNISTDQAMSIHKDNLKLNYDQLTEQQKQFEASLGLDKAKFDESKRQFDVQTAQQASQFAKTYGLEVDKFNEAVKEFGITTDQAQQIHKDNLKLNYDQLSEQQKQFEASLGLDKAKFDESKREFDAQQQTQKDLAQMQVNADQWKQLRTEQLAQLGWNREDANLAADRQLKTTLANQDRALQREIESGRIAQADKELVQQAVLAGNEENFKRWATEKGLSNDAANRAWQTSERIAQNTYLASESSIDRQLEKELEAGRLTMQQKELAQRALEFSTQDQFNKSELAANMSNEEKNRVWQSAENAKKLKQEADLKQIDNALEEKGLNLSYLMSNIDTMNEKQVAVVLNQIAKDAGLTYTITNPDGTTVQVDGLQPMPKSSAGSATPDAKKSTFEILKTDPNSVISDPNVFVDSSAMINNPSSFTHSKSKWTGVNKTNATSTFDTWVNDNVGKYTKLNDGSFGIIRGYSTGPKSASITVEREDGRLENVNIWRTDF